MAPSFSKRALSLGGGGFTGYLFEIGALTALDDLFEDGVTMNDLDLYVGVSAGAAGASLLANGVRPQELLDTNLSGTRPYYFDHRNVFSPAIGEGLCVSNAFQTNMVLQRDKPLTVWGWADAGEEVTISFAGQQARAKAAADRSWQVTLKAMPANSTPQTMTVKGKNKTLALENAEIKIHTESLKQLGESFQAEAQPMVVDVEGRTLQLKGSAEEQYAEWRQLLRELYEHETGLPVSSSAAVPPGRP